VSLHAELNHPAGVFVHSQAQGPVVRLLEETIAAAFDDAVARNPAGTALVSCHQNVRLSYEELRNKVDALAAGLWSTGIRPGDRIGVWASNCVEWICLQFSAARTGAVLVNVNPAYRSHELRYVLARSRMKAIFLHEQDARVNYLEVLEESRHGQDLALEHVIVLGGDAWNALAQARGPAPRPPAVPQDVASIQYTSGTTGAPKGVLLTHRNLLNNAMLIGRQMQVSSTDRLCSPVPLYHCFGCVMSSLMTMVNSAALVLPAAQFDATATLRAVHDERCTLLYGVPTMFIAELEHPDFESYDLTSLRTGIMAGAPCPVEVMQKVTGRMHCRDLTIAYGQTESSPVVTMSSLEDGIDLRVSTVGRVMPNTEVKVVSPDTGEVVPTGTLGELCTRGYLVMKGYDGDPEGTAAAIDSEGWLHTGDIAIMRPDGYFHIRGRLKDTIIRGGENIYPREIEEFLHQHPDIVDVYVVGIPHERLGETVLAWIRLKNGARMTAADVREFCRGRIAYFKTPQYVRFVDEFPMTVTGKVQKYRIREIEIEERGLRAAQSIRTA